MYFQRLVSILVCLPSMNAFDPTVLSVSLAYSWYIGKIHDWFPFHRVLSVFCIRWSLVLMTSWDSLFLVLGSSLGDHRPCCSLGGYFGIARLVSAFWVHFDSKGDRDQIGGVFALIWYIYNNKIR